MDWNKIKDNSVKMGVFGLNIILVAGGVYYFKNQDRQKKEVQLQEAEAYNEEMALEEADRLQKAAALNEAALKESAREAELEAKKKAEELVQKEEEIKAQSTVIAETPKPAPVVAPIKVNGECGSADSSAKRKNAKCDGKAPKSGLCSVGTASAVKSKPNKYDVGWNWTCQGQNGGTSATCRCS